MVTIGAGPATRQPPQYVPLLLFGLFLSLPGTFLTCFGAAAPISILLIIGPCLLGISSLLITIYTILSLKHDWNNKNPEYNREDWNERVRYDARQLCVIWLIKGSVLACIGFAQYNRHYLAIVGCCIIGLAELVLLCGIILGRYLLFPQNQDTESSDNEPSANTASNPPVVEDVESNQDPPPNPTTNPPDSTGDTSANMNSAATFSQLQSDLTFIGITLFLPGVCFSCIGWIRYYDRIAAGILGAFLLTLGGSLISASAIILFCNSSDASKRQTAISKIVKICFLSGLIMTPVGFTHLQPGLALGIVGACLFLLAVLGFIVEKCYYNQEVNPETDSTNRRFVTTINTDDIDNRMPSFMTIQAVNEHDEPESNNKGTYPPGTNKPGTNQPGTGPNPVYPPVAGSNPAYPPGTTINIPQWSLLQYATDTDTDTGPSPIYPPGTLLNLAYTFGIRLNTLYPSGAVYMGTNPLNPTAAGINPMYPHGAGIDPANTPNACAYPVFPPATFVQPASEPISNKPGKASDDMPTDTKSIPMPEAQSNVPSAPPDDVEDVPPPPSYDEFIKGSYQ